MRTRADEDRLLDLQVHAVGVGGAQPLVHRQQRHRLAVYRDLDLLVADGRSRQTARGRVLERHREEVVPVGGEVVHHREPAARAVRRALHPVPLRVGPRLRVGRLLRSGVRIADGELGHLGGGAQVAVEQRRRQQLHVGDVVEVGAHRVERQVVAGVDPESEQVIDGPLVLVAVQPLERPVAGIRILGGRLVHHGFQRLDQRRERPRFGPADPRRGHHVGPQLADHLLGALGLFRTGRRRGDVEILQREVAGQHAVVVTCPAVALHDPGQLRVVRHGLGGRRNGFLGGGAGGRVDGQDGGREEDGDQSGGRSKCSHGDSPGLAPNDRAPTAGFPNPHSVSVLGASGSGKSTEHPRHESSTRFLRSERVRTAAVDRGGAPLVRRPPALLAATGRGLAPSAAGA